MHGGELLFMVERGNAHVFVNADGREDAKRKARNWLGGDPDNYIVSQLTAPGDRIHFQHHAVRMSDRHPYAHELTTGEDVVTFYYPPADGSIESLRRAAQWAADAEEMRIDLYVMPREGDEWVFDTYYEPRTIND